MVEKTNFTPDQLALLEIAHWQGDCGNKHQQFFTLPLYITEEEKKMMATTAPSTSTAKSQKKMGA